MRQELGYLYSQTAEKRSSRKLPLVLTAKVNELMPSLCFDTYKEKGDGSQVGKAKREEMAPRRPRRRYNRNVELILGILVIVLVIVLLVWLID
jgi:hypothetical protein